MGRIGLQTCLVGHAHSVFFNLNVLAACAASPNFYLLCKARGYGVNLPEFSHGLGGLLLGDYTGGRSLRLIISLSVCLSPHHSLHSFVHITVPLPQLSLLHKMMPFVYGWSTNCEPVSLTDSPSISHQLLCRTLRDTLSDPSGSSDTSSLLDFPGLQI